MNLFEKITINVIRNNIFSIAVRELIIDASFLIKMLPEFSGNAANVAKISGLQLHISHITRKIRFQFSPLN